MMMHTRSFSNILLIQAATRESVSSFSSGSVRSSISSSPKNRNRNTGASYTSSVPATISERAVSPHPFAAQSFKAPSVSTAPGRPQGLTRSVSGYALRDHALSIRSHPQQSPVVAPTYFCVHCGHGFDKRADWETHEWIFHERQSFWPCPQPGCQSFFDSGRAFEAHHQAVHGCGKCDHASRVVQLLPERKAWACGFKNCKEVFLDWGKRCKHVATHYEMLIKRQGNFRDSPEWTYSTTVRNLLRQPELREPFKKFMTKCHGHSKSTWPMLEWQPDKCAELQRCLEYRDFTRGVPDIIHLAYRSGHPGYASPPQVISRPPSPPASGVFVPPTVSPRSSSLRSRARSRSIRSVMSENTMSPSSPNRSSSGRPYLYERKSSAPSRISDVPSFNSAPLLSPTSPSLSLSTRDLSPLRTPSIFSTTTELQRPKTATTRRMVAREPEVRGTSSRALLEFLKEGPPTGPTKGEHRARRPPRAVPVIPDAAGLGLDSLLSTSPNELVDSAPPLIRKHSKPAPDFDIPISPVREDDAEQNYTRTGASLDNTIEQALPTPTLLLPDERFATRTDAQEDRPAQQADEKAITPQVPIYAPSEPPAIKETVIEMKGPTYQLQDYGHKVLPPTPGPPPSQLLPLPPMIELSRRANLPDTPTTEHGDVPPSPMPPGFTDIANWPAPPEAAAPPVPSLPRSPSPPLLPETPIIPTHIPPISISVPPPEIPHRPQTANPNPNLNARSEVLKLLPPPKRARSTSRGRPRPLRWVSISTMIEPPAPSPGVDFGTCLSQPLDLAQPMSQPRSINA